MEKKEGKEESNQPTKGRLPRYWENARGLKWTNEGTKFKIVRKKNYLSFRSHNICMLWSVEP